MHSLRLATQLIGRHGSPGRLVRYVADQLLLPGLTVTVPDKLRLALLRGLADVSVAAGRAVVLEEDAVAAVSALLANAPVRQSQSQGAEVFGGGPWAVADHGGDVPCRAHRRSCRCRPTRCRIRRSTFPKSSRLSTPSTT